MVCFWVMVIRWPAHSPSVTSHGRNRRSLPPTLASLASEGRRHEGRRTEAEGVVHGPDCEEEALTAEEHGHLGHEVRLGPIAGDVHVDLELRGREEGVDTALLAVEVELGAYMWVCLVYGGVGE